VSCWLVHNWCNWRKIGVANTYEHPDESDTNVKVLKKKEIIQEKECLDCGLIRTRRIRL